MSEQARCCGAVSFGSSVVALDNTPQGEKGAKMTPINSDQSGYRPCACEICPEIAIGVAGAVCGDCEDAGCTEDGCEREDEIFAEFFPDQEFATAPR